MPSCSSQGRSKSANPSSIPPSAALKAASHVPWTYYLRRRVEVATPVTDPECRQRLDEILTIELNDPTAWDLDADGAYHRRSAPSAARSAQQQFLARGCAG